MCLQNMSKYVKYKAARVVGETNPLGAIIYIAYNELSIIVEKSILPKTENYVILTIV